MFYLFPIRVLSICVLLCISAQFSYGLIFYSGDNSLNQSTPDPERSDIFNAIARVCNDGGGGTSGSAIHIRGKYMLTANHVRVHNHGSNPTDSVTFDGVNFWAQDNTFTPIQISSSDMKLFKLVKDPGLPETPLFKAEIGDVLATGTLIGWGRGRDPGIADSGNGATNIWQWGSNSTLAKRWGTNLIDISGTGDVAGYTYTYLRTDLDHNEGDDEAALAIFDSGSGLFINDNNVWKLAGLGTAVSTNNSSTFSLAGDLNYFVRITTYATDIENSIPDTTTFSGWKIDHGLYGDDALNDADTDDDGIGQLLEFALGGDPNSNNRDILPTMALTEDGGSTYLELSLTRPDNLQNIVYTPQTTNDLTSWPADSTGISNANPTPINAGEGHETLTYRRAEAISEQEKAFIRVEITEQSP